MLDVSRVSDEMMMYRAERNLTQEEFAKELGITRASVCNIERGNQIPKKTTALKILMYINQERSDKNEVENNNEKN